VEYTQKISHFQQHFKFIFKSVFTDVFTFITLQSKLEKSGNAFPRPKTVWEYHFHGCQPNYNPGVAVVLGGSCPGGSCPGWWLSMAAVF